jgi:hypothetical protein
VASLGLAAPSAAIGTPAATANSPAARPPARPAAAGPAAAAAAPAASAADDDAPLSLTIDTLTPSSIPQQGKVRVSGYVTNNSDEVWSAVNVHAFIAGDPITSSSDLAFESTRGIEESVGDRITVPGTFDTITELAPGASAPYTDRIPVDVLGADEPGVYWFGVHALGSNAAGRDAVADGRARTFLPYVPPEGRAPPIDTALVLPIRKQVLRDPDGRVSEPDAWATALEEGGSLASIVDFGLAAGSRPITWLIDPAVPHAVTDLRDGNRPRALVQAPDGEGAEASESPDASASPEPQTPAAPGADPAAVAVPWLAKLQTAVTGKQVLALPWGDVDVAAAAKRETAVYTEARDRSGTVLQVSQAPMTPAMSAPSGYLDDAALALADGSTTILVADRAVTRGRAPSVASYAGKKVVFYSTDALDGGPGPDDPMAPVAVRQRILSEAAVRMEAPAQRPLVVVFPPSWSPPGDDYAEFFAGLDVNWMRLASVADATVQAGRPLAADRFGYPSWQVNHEVDDPAFTALADLTDEARRLQNVLTVENDLTSRIRTDALANLSYFARENAGRSRLATVDTAAWVRARLGSITVSGPRRVILSSNSGPFSVTITNGLDEPVTIRILVTSSPPMTITVPERLELEADSTTTRLLEASTDKLGVHNVTITVTDVEGNPLGSRHVVPVRAAQVSQVIWLIMGVAVALLFVAIVLRLIRRIRGSGPPDGDGGADDADQPPSGASAGEPDREPAPAR